MKNYKRWKIYNFGEVVGATEMSRQLINHHALVCGLEASQSFRNYQGNAILSETTVSPKVNHWVEIVGEGS